MLKTIDIASGASKNVRRGDVLDDHPEWIIKRQHVVHAKQAGDFLAQTRAQADMVLLKAQQQAQEYREAGFRQGLEMGVHVAMEPMVTLLSQLQTIKEKLRTDAIACAQSSMEAFLVRSPALTALLDTVLDAHMSGMPSAVRLSVSANADIAALQAHCNGLGVDARIEAVQGEGLFAASWEGHLWEVRVDSLCGPSRVGSAGVSEALPEAVARTICRDALQAHVDRLEGGRDLTA